MEKKRNPIIDEPSEVEFTKEEVVEVTEIKEVPKVEKKVEQAQAPAGYVHVESIAGKTKGKIYTIPKAFVESNKEFYSEANGYKVK